MRAKTDVFVPNGPNRQETAVLLVGTADEHGIDQRSIRSVSSGFYITEELADLIYGADETELEVEVDETEDYYDPADYTAAQVKEFVEAHSELAEDILASESEGKNRQSLVKWLADQTSGNRAAKNSTAEKE